MVESIRDALGYPIRGGAWMLLVGGALLSLLVELMVNHGRTFGLAALVLGLGYFAAYIFAIVDTTIAGKDDAPEWPSFSDFRQHLVAPFFRFAGIVLLSFGPLFVFKAIAWQTRADLDVLSWVATAYGWLYFPMALATASSMGSVFAALPHVVVPQIARAMPRYVLPVAAIAVAFEFFGSVGEMLGAIPFLGRILATLVGMYALMLEARLVGLLYRESFPPSVR